MCVCLFYYGSVDNLRMVFGCFEIPPFTVAKIMFGIDTAIVALLPLVGIGVE